MTQRSKQVKRNPAGKSTRPGQRSASAEARRLGELLVEELLRWPGVTTLPMFGLRAVHRRGAVFALLPAQRAVGPDLAILYKFPEGSESREGQKWKLFEVRDESLIHAALDCLRAAYDLAGRDL